MPRQNRRSFISTAAAAAGLAAVPALGSDEAVAQAPGGTRFDLSWLDQMKGVRKQVLDLATHDLAADPNPLRFVRNFVETFGEVYGLKPDQISTMVGVARTLPLVATDRLWEKYKLGEMIRVTDPATKQPATRNIFYNEGRNSVTAIQSLGTVFWQCNRAAMTLADTLSTRTGQPAAEIHADLVAGLVPGVRLVPSHVMAVALAHERGFSYVKA
jgi:hypothetical protein